MDEKAFRIFSIPLPLFATWVVLTFLLILFSQSGAGYSDEGVHLLASQLIIRGKLPYADFFHQHPPLYLFLNAAWMKLFGDTWRMAHLFSALLTAGGVILTGKFVYERITQASWRVPGAMTASLLTGLHLMVFQFGMIGQAYGLCLLLTMAAVYLITCSHDRNSGLKVFCAGLCAGGAAASWLLSLPLLAVLFLWILKYSPPQSRFKGVLLFIFGSAVPFLPLLVLAVKAPVQVVFDMVEFHLFHRRLGTWSEENVLRWDFIILTRWMKSKQTLLLVLLAGLGFFTIRKEMEPLQKRAFYLCVWLIPALASLSALAHPTFVQYFILLVPFLSILASVGLVSLVRVIRPFLSAKFAVIAFAIIFAYPTERVLFNEISSGSSSWLVTEQIGREIHSISNATARLYAGEGVYFASRRIPPAGLENSYAWTVHLPEVFARSVHIVKRDKINHELATGKFDVVVMWADDSRVNLYQMKEMYNRITSHGNYYVFSRSVPPPK